MSNFEYRVVPAPKRGIKTRGAKSVEDQFAHALTLTINDAAAEGWEYLRTDTLPCEERQGLTGRVTTFQNMLVFRRLTAEAAAAHLRAAADSADAQRAVQSAATVATMPQITAPTPAPLRLDKPAPAETVTRVPTPELRADASTRMAAE